MGRKKIETKKTNSIQISISSLISSQKLKKSSGKPKPSSPLKKSSLVNKNSPKKENKTKVESVKNSTGKKKAESEKKTKAVRSEKVKLKSPKKSATPMKEGQKKNSTTKKSSSAKKIKAKVAASENKENKTNKRKSAEISENGQDGPPRKRGRPKGAKNLSKGEVQAQAATKAGNQTITKMFSAMIAKNKNKDNKDKKEKKKGDATSPSKDGEQNGSKNEGDKDIDVLNNNNNNNNEDSPKRAKKKLPKGIRADEAEVDSVFVVGPKLSGEKADTVVIQNTSELDLDSATEDDPKSPEKDDAAVESSDDEMLEFDSPVSGNDLPSLASNKELKTITAQVSSAEKKKEFVCSVCKLVFPNRYYIRKHKLKVHENQLYKCKVCDFNSVYPEKLKNHIIKLHVTKKEKNDRSSEKMETELKQILHKKVPRKLVMEDGVTLGRSKKSIIGFACAICESVYPSRYSLERHVRSHTGEKPYQCQVCDFSTSYHEHMVRHTTSVHLVVHSDEPRPKYIPKHKRPEEEEDENSVIDPKTGKVRRNISRKRYECAACGLKATHKADLVHHIKEKHPNAHIESMTNRDGSKIHLIVTMSKKQKETKRLTIVCLFCSKVFHDSWKYKVHLRSHTGVKPFRCSVCGFRATTKMTVRDHIHRKHPESNDGKIIIRTVGIDGTVDEIEIAIPQREYKCEFCDQNLEDNYALKTHRLQKHPEANPFSCLKCGHREGAKALLLIHCMTEHKETPAEELILRNGKPFKLGMYKVPTCDICGKMFGYQSQLYVHQRVHTGERNYNCDNCGFGTNSKVSLENHILKVHLGLDVAKDGKKGRKKRRKKGTGTEDEEEEEEIDGHTCPECGFIARNVSGLKKHYQSIHGLKDVERKDASTTMEIDDGNISSSEEEEEEEEEEGEEEEENAVEIDISKEVEDNDEDAGEMIELDEQAEIIDLPSESTEVVLG